MYLLLIFLLNGNFGIREELKGVIVRAGHKKATLQNPEEYVAGPKPTRVGHM